MPRVKLPINVADEKQTDDFSLDTLSRVQLNGYFSPTIDDSGNLNFSWNKRPGLVEWCDLGEAAAVDGLFWWPRQQKMVATCNGKTFFVTEGGVPTEVTGTATMVAGVRPTYADVQGSTLYQASSGQIGKFPSLSTGSYLTDPDAPTTVTHIGTNNKYLIALNTNSEQFDWSVVNEPENWDSDFASSEASPDLARGLFVSNGEVIIPGESTLEVFKDNGTTFARIAGGVVETGCIAPYSFTLIDGIPYWINEASQVVKLEGRTPTVISKTYSKYIQSFSEVSDAKGDYLKIGGNSYYILYFPTEGKTLVYDLVSSRWSEWTYWNGSTHTAFKGNCYANAKTWGFQLVGDRTTGKIYKIDPSYEDDAGDTIKSVLRTNNITHGTVDVKKFSNQLTFKLKRTKEASTAATLSMKYRDNGSTTWKNSRTLTIESSTATDLAVKTRRLGSYYSRQYEIEISDDSNIALMEIEEDFQIGDST